MNKKIHENMWKTNNKQYLFELQKFLDLADNIKDEKLRKNEERIEEIISKIFY